MEFSIGSGESIISDYVHSLNNALGIAGKNLERGGRAYRTIYIGWSFSKHCCMRIFSWFDNTVLLFSKYTHKKALQGGRRLGPTVK
jgi:hypothetical protein